LNFSDINIGILQALLSLPKPTGKTVEIDYSLLQGSLRPFFVRVQISVQKHAVYTTHNSFYGGVMTNMF